MKNEIRDTFKKIASTSGSDGTIEQFMAILDLPDEKFDSVYPTFKEKLSEIFESSSFQKEVLDNINMNPNINIEEESAAIKEFIAEIKADDSLSDNKKDMLITLIDKSLLSVYELVKNPRERISVKIQKISEDAVIPTYAHDSDAGCDVYAIEETVLKPHETVLVKTGIKVGIPLGYELQLRPRSGTSLKTNIRIANTPGTIDANYRGEVGVICTNTGNLSYTINKGDKIAQMIIAKSPMIKWEEVTELDETDRAENGFGSSDNK
jgi:dUTP pyrophosphatase